MVHWYIILSFYRGEQKLTDYSAVLVQVRAWDTSLATLYWKTICPVWKVDREIQRNSNINLSLSFKHQWMGRFSVLLKYYKFSMLMMLFKNRFLLSSPVTTNCKINF